MSEIVSREMLAKYLTRNVTAGSVEDLVRMGINSGIDKYCGRVIVGATYAEQITIPDWYMDRFMVSNPPIRTWTSLGSGLTNPSLVDVSSYIVNKDIGQVVLVNTFFTRGVGQYTATYDGGYDPVPPELQLFAMSIMARECEKVAKGRHGMRGRSMAQGTAEFFQLDMEPVEKLFLNAYRIQRFD